MIIIIVKFNIIQKHIILLQPLREIDRFFNFIKMTYVSKVIRSLRNSHKSIADIQIDFSTEEIFEPHEFNDFIQALSNARHVTFFNMQDKDQPDDTCIQIVEALSKHNNDSLKTLDLSGNHLTNSGLKTIFEYISKMSNLHHLYLSYNDFDRDGLVTICDYIGSDQNTLQTLHIDNNQSVHLSLDTRSLLISNYLRSALASPRNHISELNIGQNDIHHRIDIILEGVKQSEIKHLNISRIIPSLDIHNVWRLEFFDKLKPFLSDNRLETLQIGSNSFRVEGTQMLFNCIARNNTIQHLDMFNNGLGDEGSKLLAEYLERNNSVQILNIVENGIGDEGIEFIAESLKTNTGVFELHIGWNNFGVRGIMALESMLLVNKTIHKISMTHNQERLMTNRVKKLLKKSNRLKVIDWMPRTHRYITGRMFQDERNLIGPPLPDQEEEVISISSDDDLDRFVNMSLHQPEEEFIEISDDDSEREGMFEPDNEENLQRLVELPLHQPEENELLFGLDDFIIEQEEESSEEEDLEKTKNLSLLSQEFDRTVTDLLSVFYSSYDKGGLLQKEKKKIKKI